MTAEPLTDFGFSDIPEHEKAGKVRAIFDRVSSRYDLMNDAMSLGLHRAWKSALIGMLRPRANMELLDVAGGTGDIALRFIEGGGGHVTVCDINASMLQEGRNRCIDRNRAINMEWVCADAEQIPFPDRHFDAYTVAFGIRNVTHRERALAEARRVLKPGGRFLCLEFAPPAPGFFQRCYDAYSFHVIPRLGSLLAGDSESYRYLVESIRRFPKQEAFAEEIISAGFAKVSHRNLSGGIVAIHSGWRI